jgi:hypothetical protein
MADSPNLRGIHQEIPITFPMQIASAARSAL